MTKRNNNTPDSSNIAEQIVYLKNKNQNNKDKEKDDITLSLFESISNQNKYILEILCSLFSEPELKESIIKCFDANIANQKLELVGKIKSKNKE